MVIGFDGSRAFVEGRTGTENYSYQLLKALSRLDLKNKYIVYVRPYSVIARSEATKQSGSEREIAASVEDSLLAMTKGGKISSPAKPDRNDEGVWPNNFQFKEIPWPRLWTQGGLAIQTFKDNLDVLFVPAHTLPLIRKPGLKTVVTVHDLGSEYLPSMHQLKQQLYLRFMQKFQLKTATKIIAVSKATKEDLINRGGIDPKKVSVVYEGYDKDLFKPASARGRSSFGRNSLRQYDLQPGGYFLFVGTVQPRKNLERLVKAFSVHLRGAGLTSPGAHLGGVATQLVIAGSKGWLSEEIYKLPKKLGIEKKVKFLGYVPEKDLPVLYSGALAFTFPSLFEGFGLPILEAQACGCPVLTSNASSMPEVGGKGAVYVDPYSIDDIVKGMEKVASDKGQVTSGKAGLENIKRFSWEKCAAETLEILESI